jgi:hypothetical protein
MSGFLLWAHRTRLVRRVAQEQAAVVLQTWQEDNSASGASACTAFSLQSSLSTARLNVPEAPLMNV